jgi:hypothetical protein
MRLENVSIKFGRWTKYPGGVYDNRPTKVITPVETHGMDGFNLQFVDGVAVASCSAYWTSNLLYEMQPSISAENTTALQIWKFQGDSAAHPILLK